MMSFPVCSHVLSGVLVLKGRGSGPRGIYSLTGVVPYPPCEQTDTYKNIFFPNNFLTFLCDQGSSTARGCYQEGSLRRARGQNPEPFRRIGYFSKISMIFWTVQFNSKSNMHQWLLVTSDVQSKWCSTGLFEHTLLHRLRCFNRS